MGMGQAKEWSQEWARKEKGEREREMNGRGETKAEKNKNDRGQAIRSEEEKEMGIGKNVNIQTDSCDEEHHTFAYRTFWLSSIMIVNYDIDNMR